MPAHRSEDVEKHFAENEHVVKIPIGKEKKDDSM